MPIPIDFEKLVKLPDANGYPFSLRSDDLMKNFSWCDLLPSAEADSVRIELDEVAGVTAQHKQRRIRVVGSPFDHPWKVTDLGDGAVSIAAGFANGYFLYYEDAGVPIGPDASGGPTTIVVAPLATYSGGTETISGTQYIYAEVPRNQAADEYCQSEGSGNDIVLASVYNEMNPSNFVDGNQADTASIVVSSTTPEAYIPTTDKAARCIAKVSESGGGLVINQYITHNFDMFLPIVKLTVVTNTSPP
jgi:hypothetical protein